MGGKIRSAGSVVPMLLLVLLSCGFQSSSTQVFRAGHLEGVVQAGHLINAEDVGREVINQETSPFRSLLQSQTQDDKSKDDAKDDAVVDDDKGAGDAQKSSTDDDAKDDAADAQDDAAQKKEGGDADASNDSSVDKKQDGDADTKGGAPPAKQDGDADGKDEAGGEDDVDLQKEIDEILDDPELQKEIDAILEDAGLGKIDALLEEASKQNEAAGQGSIVAALMIAGVALLLQMSCIM